MSDHSLFYWQLLIYKAVIFFLPLLINRNGKPLCRHSHESGNLIILPYAIWRYALYYDNDYGNVLYIGVTSDLFTRIPEHKNKVYPNSFTAKYNCNKLVYYETYARIEDAIAREKQLKKWNRAWKDELISKVNPEWKDLFESL